MRIQLYPHSFPSLFPPPLPSSHYQNTARFFIQVGGKTEKGRTRMKEEKQWGTFPFPKNSKMESILTVSSKTIQLEIRVIMKNQGGGGVRKLFHFNNQTKIKNKKGNKRKRISNCNFPAISVHTGANPTQHCWTLPLWQFAFFFSVLYFLCGFQLFCWKFL